MTTKIVAIMMILLLLTGCASSLEEYIGDVETYSTFYCIEGKKIWVLSSKYSSSITSQIVGTCEVVR